MNCLGPDVNCPGPDYNSSQHRVGGGRQDGKGQGDILAELACIPKILWARRLVLFPWRDIAQSRTLDHEGEKVLCVLFDIDQAVTDNFLRWLKKAFDTNHKQGGQNRSVNKSAKAQTFLFSMSAVVTWQRNCNNGTDLPSRLLATERNSAPSSSSNLICSLNCSLVVPEAVLKSENDKSLFWEMLPTK